MSDHSPDCTTITFRELAAELGKDIDPDDPWYDLGGIVRCVPDCPAWDDLDQEDVREAARRAEVVRHREAK